MYPTEIHLLNYPLCIINLETCFHRRMTFRNVRSSVFEARKNVSRTILKAKILICLSADRFSIQILLISIVKFTRMDRILSNAQRVK